MKAAIYARYSSDNQRPESIDDQVRACLEVAVARGFSVAPEHIFSDEAKSGALRSRPALERLREAVAAHAVDAVLIDDLSRLSRDNHYLLTLYAEFRFHGVRIVSRADSLDSEDERAKLGFQMRGIVNELFLDDLREKTLRGQKGQKARGFSVGEATFGYKSEPVGEMRLDRRGRPRPEGYRMVVYAPEAEIVRRIYLEFATGKAITAIVRDLNAESIPGRRVSAHGWTPSTISRILKNEKYAGRWAWNRTETRRDPRTGRKRRVPKPESEWHVVEDEDLRIVPADVWDRVAARWKEIDRTWPTRRGLKGFEGQQRSYVSTHPTHLLSGSLRCGACGGSIGQVSGKAGGYYGCLAAMRSRCANKLLVRRRLVERILLATLREQVCDREAIGYVMRRVEVEVRRLHGHLPELMRDKRSALAAEERRIANFIGFIGDGKGTPALGQALENAELRARDLTEELAALEATAKSVLRAPPAEWIAHRLQKLDGLLGSATERSALLLRRVLGTVKLTPVTPELGRSCYRAETAVEVLDLLAEASDDGSNSLQQWRRGELNPRPKALDRKPLHA